MTPPTPDEVRATVAATGLSQAAFARALELPERTVSRWLAGDREIDALKWEGVLVVLTRKGLLPSSPHAKK